MEDYILFHEREGEVWKRNKEYLKEELNIAANSWSNFVTAKLFEEVKYDAVLAVAYKAQADGAIFNAITSVLNGHLGQASGQIRYAIDNLSIFASIFMEFETFQDIYAKYPPPTSAEKIDDAMRNTAYKLLEQRYKSHSLKLKSIKSTLNSFGIHQGVSSLGSDIVINNDSNKLSVSLFDENYDEKAPFIMGIISSIMHEYLTVFIDIDSNKKSNIMHLNDAAVNNIDGERNKLDAMRKIIRNIIAGFGETNDGK